MSLQLKKIFNFRTTIRFKKNVKIKGLFYKQKMLKLTYYLNYNLIISSKKLFFIKLKFTKSVIQRVFKLFKEKKNN